MTTFKDDYTNKASYKNNDFENIKNYISSYLFQVLGFVDEHGNEVLNLGSFTLIPKHVVTLILSREELRADEFTKFQVTVHPVWYPASKCLHLRYSHRDAFRLFSGQFKN